MKSSLPYLSKIILLVTLIGFGLIYLFSQDLPFARTPKIYSVVLTEQGFEPSSLEIQKGDFIEFSTTRDQPFWPASDLHPTHELYSDFDPLQPVPKDSRWKFQFQQSGEWRYHDHLSPFYRALVTVK